MDNMTIKHGNGRFYIGESEAEATAEIIYEPVRDGVIGATRTYVSDEWRGQGVAGKLLDRLVEYARAEELRIVPQCSYVEKKFSDQPETYKDVAAKA